MDKRRSNTQTTAQRRASIKRRRKVKSKSKISRDRLEAAKTILRRSHGEVYDAAIDDPRFEGFIRVDAKKYTHEEVLAMAAAVLEREAKRRAELLAEHGVKVKR